MAMMPLSLLRRPPDQPEAGGKGVDCGLRGKPLLAELTCTNTQLHLHHARQVRFTSARQISILLSLRRLI